MTPTEFKRKETIEAAARVVCARLKRQGLKQPWKPVLEFLATYPEPESEEAKTAAVEHFLGGASDLAVGTGTAMAAPAEGQGQDMVPVEPATWQEDAPPRQIVRRSDLPAPAPIATAPAQKDLVIQEALSLGYTLGDAEIEAIALDLENRHGGIVADTAAIIDALKQWALMVEEKTNSEIARIHTELSATLSESHGRVAARVANIFSDVRQASEKHTEAHQSELGKLTAFFAARGISVGCS